MAEPSDPLQELRSQLLELTQQLRDRDETIEGLRGSPPVAHTTRSAHLGEMERIDERPDAHLASELASHKTRLAEALGELHGARSKMLKAQKLESIGQIAAGIAHEVNTPAQYVADNISFLQRAFDKLLRLIEAQSGLVEGVRRGQLTPLMLEAADAARREVKLDYLARQVPRAVEQSMHGLEQISSIVKAMKEFSHPSGAEKQPSDLHDLIECVTVVVRSEWRHVADLELDFDWSLPPVPVLRIDLAQVMLDLVVNAAQAISAALPQAATHKGKIVIATKLVEKHVHLRVSDNGGGIPEAVQPRVFEPGFSTKPAGTTRGRGLSAARAAVVDKHGGTLHFESTPGVGTTFIVCLPLAAS